MIFDVAVIGLGMIDSAALRYLSKPETGLRVVGIGPAEPQDWSAHTGAFASHYDQARITRITDPDEIWAILAQRAIGSYAEIERSSGVRFHFPVGHLRVNPDAGAETNPFIASEQVGRALDAPVEHLDRAQLAAQFPYLNIPATAEGLYERGGAGVINPRALVAAQLAIAAAQGAALVREEVRGFAHAGNNFEISTNGGQTVRAARILISTHGYTNDLLRASLNRTLDLVNMAHTTVYAELDAGQAQRLAGMPSIIWPLSGHPVLPSVYTTPPMSYPDGRVRIKIGGPLYTHPTLDTPHAMREWFHSVGNPIEIAALQGVLLDLLPGLAVREWSSNPCMNTYTPHDHPYIDQLDDGVFICTGGCGSGAKSSDEVGRVGALLAQHGAWSYDLPASAFRTVEA